MANPNIVQATSIYGKTDVLSVLNTFSSITSNPSASGKVLKINSLVLSNIDGASPVDVSVALARGGVDYYIASAISIPATSSVVVIGKENPMYMNEGDALRVIAGSTGDAQALCSYEEIG